MTSLTIQKRQTAIDAIIHIAVVIVLAALLIPAPAQADCSKLIDKNLEYYVGIKQHLSDMTAFDPGIKKLPYDVKIIDNHSQKYALFSRNISFYYPNTADQSVDLAFQGGFEDQNGYIQAICIVQTPDGSKWILWRDNFRLYFYDEDEKPH